MKLLNRRRAGIAVVAAALAVSFTPPAQAASAAGWDDKGTHDVYYSSHYRTKAVKSGGGDFRACITSSTSTKEFYNLYEEDSINDKRVATVEGAGCWVFRDIGDYVDGDNNRAEFYIGSEDAQMLRVHYYD